MSKTKPPDNAGMRRMRRERKLADSLDFDYLTRLNANEYDWLIQFCREYYRGSFADPETDLHSTPEGRRACYTDNNNRNRDVWNKFDRIQLWFGDEHEWDDDAQ